MKVDEALHDVSNLAFDTAPIIYFVEANPAYDELVSDIFNRVATGVINGWTSVISLIEVLVQPIISRRNDLRRRSENCFSIAPPHCSGEYKRRGARRSYSRNLWPSAARCNPDRIRA